MDKLGKFAVGATVALVCAAALAEPYNNLFRVMHPNGDCQIRRPGAAAFEPVIKGKAYPFGTAVSCGADSSAILLFTEVDAVRLLADTAVDVHTEGEARVVTLNRGTVVTRIGANTTNDTVLVDTPLGRCSSLIGNCKVTLSSLPALESVELRTEAVSQMKFVGPQYIFPLIKNGFAARVSTTPGGAYTEIADLLGDYPVYVNTGLDPDPPGPVDENQEIQPVKMTTRSVLKMWRERAAVGGRTIVSVFATGPTGRGRESFAFAVGKANFAARSNMFFDIVTNELVAAGTPFGGGGGFHSPDAGGLGEFSAPEDDFSAPDDGDDDAFDGDATPPAADDDLFDF